MKNRKMQTKLLFAALLMATTVAVSGCGGETSPTETTPETANGTSGVTIAETEGETLPAEVNVSFSIKDQKGNALADVTVVISEPNSENAPRMLKTDADGAASVVLYAGDYSVELLNLPEYHLHGSTALTVAEGMDTVSLEVINNTPDGSEEHPFFINEDSATFTFAADTTYHFTMFGGDRRTIVIQNPDVEVIFGGTTYRPDETGTIKIPLVVDDMQNHITYSVKSAKAQDVVITIESAPGSTDNPIIAEADKDITVEVPKDTIMYFSYIAHQSGTLTLTSPDTINNISITNRSTSEATNFSNGSTDPLTINISAGDQVAIAVSVVGGDNTLESQTVTFKLVENG